MSISIGGIKMSVTEDHDDRMQFTKNGELADVKIDNLISNQEDGYDFISRMPNIQIHRHAYSPPSDWLGLIAKVGNDGRYKATETDWVLLPDGGDEDSKKLNDLSNVTIDSPQNTQNLIYKKKVKDSNTLYAYWTNTPISFSELTDVDISSPVPLQPLVFGSSNWADLTVDTNVQLRGFNIYRWGTGVYVVKFTDEDGEKGVIDNNYVVLVGGRVYDDEIDGMDGDDIRISEFCVTEIHRDGFAVTIRYAPYVRINRSFDFVCIRNQSIFCHGKYDHKNNADPPNYTG